MSKLDYTSLNTKVESWGKDVVNDIKKTASSMGVEHRASSPNKSASLPKIIDRYKIRDGIVTVVKISFPQSLIWTHKGAGRGQGGTKGSRWVDKYGNPKTTNPQSLGKMNTGNRKSKPFFNSALDNESGINELADIVANELGTSIIDKMFIK